MTLEMPFLQTIALTYNERRGFDGHPFDGQGWPTKPLLRFLQKRMNEGVASFFALGGIGDGVGGAPSLIRFYKKRKRGGHRNPLFTFSKENAN